MSIRLIVATLTIILMLSTLSYPVQAQQHYVVNDSEVEIWINDIWEHKVILSMRWNRPAGVCKIIPAIIQHLPDKVENCPLSRNVFTPNNTSQTTDERVNYEAKIACDFYKREAVGPLSVWRMDNDRWEFQYTYACAIR